MNKTKKTYSLLVPAILIIILNAFDAFSTIYWVGAGVATEVNPFMKLLLDHSPFMFFAFKHMVASVFGLLLVTLPIKREHKWTIRLIWGTIGIYGLLAMYHIVMSIFFLTVVL